MEDDFAGTTIFQTQIYWIGNRNKRITVNINTPNIFFLLLFSQTDF